MTTPVGLVLAAGAGSRLGGRAKALLCWQGRPLLHRVLDAFVAADIPELCVVTGAHADAVAACTRDWPGGSVHTLHNPTWATGQASSVATALRAARRHRWPGLLITPVDQPDLDAAVIARMASQPGAAQPVLADGSPTHPALIPAADYAAVIAALASGPADRGAGPWLRAHGRSVSVADLVTRRPRDLDTEQDLEQP